MAGTLTGVLALGTLNAGSATAADWEEMYSSGVGVCMTPYGGGTGNGANIVQWDCDPIDNVPAHNWSWETVSGGNQIRNRVSNKRVTLYGGSTANGVNLVQWDCNGSAAQKWYKDGSAPDAIIIHAVSRKCMTSKGGNQRSNGVEITLWDCNGHYSQNWFVRDIHS
ncbi:RICIN domain-containing protein [Streptomyces sp. NPDC088707]|uniref:RICIN domain-containing protein n=1 Tax=Streptomyces sp. NPDC088707 TaxID=3365871 RepID=UPI003806B97D